MIFKLAVLVFRCLHGTAPAYLADKLRRVTNSDSRRRLRSASTSALVVPPTRRMTIGDRAFPVSGARVWNALPYFVTDSATVATFKRHLKTYLCEISFLRQGPRKEVCFQASTQPLAHNLLLRCLVVTMFSVLESC